MKTTRNHIKLLALSPLLIAMFPSYGEETNNKKSKEAIEVIEVTGFRGSVVRALNAKRFAGNVTDAISAEDVGKSTDQNIAEALQRVTGVSIQRDGGEGTLISVRGAGPDLNNISLNGINLTSSGANQGVDLSQFSSDVLSSIEVVKTPSADHDEGSLGASVILKTFKPLNATKNRRTIEFQRRTNPFAGSSSDFKLSTSLSEKFLDDKLGFSVVASKETQTLREDRYDNTWWRPVSPSNGATILNPDGSQEIINTEDSDNPWIGSDINNNGTIDLSERRAWEGVDYNGDGTLTDNEKVIKGFANRQNRYSYNLRNRDRQTFSGAVQWRPNDDTDIQLDLTYSKQETGLDQNFLTVTTPNNADEPENIFWDPQTYTFTKWTNASTANNEKYTIRNHRDIGDTSQRNKVGSLRIDHLVNDDLTLTLRLGRSESSTKDDFFLRTRFGAGTSGRGTGLTSGYDCSDNIERCNLIIQNGSNFSNDANFATVPENFDFNVFDIRDRSITDIASSIYFDADWDVELGPITKLEAGLKWSSREKDNRESNSTLNKASLGLQGKTLADFYTGEMSPVWGEELGFTPSDISNGWPLADTPAALDFVFNSGITPEVTTNLNGTRRIQQDATAAYVKAEFSLLSDKLTGDIGIRYAKTEVDALGYSGFKFQTIAFTKENADVNDPDNVDFYGSVAAAEAALGIDLNDPQTAPVKTTATNSYNNLLPSLNLNYLLDKDMILRFAASETIARPKIDDLKPGFSINETAYSSVSGGTIGATHLKPFKSKNLDLSFEWYFKDDSLFAVTLFNKDFSDFSESAGFLAYWRDLRDTFYDTNGDLIPSDQLNVSITPDSVILPIASASEALCIPNREVNMAITIADGYCDVADIKSQRNGSGGYVKGVELNVQHGMTYLPGVFSGLGFLANYTYSDSSTDAEYDDNGIISVPSAPLEATSKHTYNTTLYWEKDGSLIRLAYNKRSDYLLNRLARDGTSEWAEGNDSLDLSASWKVNNALSLHFQAINLTDTVQRRYNTIRADTLIPTETFELGQQNTSRTSRLENYGSTYRVSLRLNF